MFIKPDLSLSLGVKDCPFMYTTGSCLMLVHKTFLAPVSLTKYSKALMKPNLVGWPVPKTKYPGTCLKLGAPSMVNWSAGNLKFF